MGLGRRRESIGGDEARAASGGLGRADGKREDKSADVSAGPDGNPMEVEGNRAGAVKGQAWEKPWRHGAELSLLWRRSQGPVQYGRGC